MEQKPQVQISSLGTVTGLQNEQGIETFYGIPYASVNRRWTKPGKLEAFPGGHHDGTVYGPVCPQPPNGITEYTVPGHPPNPKVPSDEFKCLNLNIARPSKISEKLPVMVWIHGGAFTIGSNAELVYNGLGLVAKSIEIGEPIIHVAINYRLGHFGFLASDELLRESGNTGVGNYALWDQRAALEFIRVHIADFGGDPERVTIFGESAGSASVAAHLVAEKPLFQRAINQSGWNVTLGPAKLESPQLQGLYDELKTLLEVPDLEALRSIPAEDLVATYEKLFYGLPASYYVDDRRLSQGFFPPGTSWLSVPSFCKAHMMGICANEGIILWPATAKRLDEVKNKWLTSGISEETLRVHGVVDGKFPPMPQLFDTLCDLLGNMVFKAPMEALKDNVTPNKTYIYRIDRKNHWPGDKNPMYHIAHHTIDLLLLAGIPKHYPSEQPEIDIKISDYMMEKWVRFSNGEEPWAPFGKKEKELIIGENGSIDIVDGARHQSEATLRMRNELVKDFWKYSDLEAVQSNAAAR